MIMLAGKRHSHGGFGSGFDSSYRSGYVLLLVLTISSETSFEISNDGTVPFPVSDCQVCDHGFCYGSCCDYLSSSTILALVLD